MNFIEELKWRGLLFDQTPGAEEHLQSGMRTGYIGFDPSAPSLGIGNLVQIMLLVHFQQCGHKPIALIGGATGMIGDPSGKSEERKLLSEEIIRFNESKIREQLSRFLDFGTVRNAAIIENNYTWFKEIKWLEFLRDVGKHLTVNYMLAKDSVKSRMDAGISFTEFSYQLMQGYDFYWLSQHRECTLQIGGSDQWGNITAGVELSRRMAAKEVFGITSVLLTKSDGTKFGKTEGGNVWLDAALTSPYKFYQYWMNISDEDASKCIRIFTTKKKEEIEAAEKEHAFAPQKRLLQQLLAKDITCNVHSHTDYEQAVRASEFLFGNATADSLKSLTAREFGEIFESVPTKKLNRDLFEEGIDIISLLVDQTNFFPSRSEARRTIQSNGVSINLEPAFLDLAVKKEHLIHNRFILLKKGKKNFFLVIAA